VIFNNEESRPTTAAQPFNINKYFEDHGHDHERNDDNANDLYWGDADEFDRPSDAGSFYERHHRRSSSYNSNYIQPSQYYKRPRTTETINVTNATNEMNSLHTSPTLQPIHTIHPIKDLREMQGIREIQDAQIQEIQEIYKGKGGQRGDYIPMLDMPATPEAVRTTFSQSYNYSKSDK
jgi:hypothetical protein